MTKRWIDRIYLAFLAVAACSELLVLAALFGAEVPYDGWWDFFGTIAVIGFLNFLAFAWVVASWKFRWMVGLETGVQIVVVLAVMALLIWGWKQSWRTKVAIMALLTLPGVALFAYGAWPRHL